MIVDSSAIITILRAEKEAELYAQAIEKAYVKRISVVSFVETAAVLDRLDDPIVSRRFADFLSVADIKIESVTQEQGIIAREAYRDFGKGSGHAAKLNFGDCFSYALAKVLREPLLCKGNDFVHTDILLEL